VSRYRRDRGLAGGGTVSDGVSISIADNGVSNSKIRQSTGVSVIGRAASSTGNVADIKAGLNNSTLVRQGNQRFSANTSPATSIEVNETPTSQCRNDDALHPDHHRRRRPIRCS
jgi:hypothetical protein